MIKACIAVGFLALNLYTYYFMAQTAVIPPRESFRSFPIRLGDWSCSAQGALSEETRVNLGATDVFMCDFTRSTPFGQIAAYVGYHQSQVREEGGGSGENAIHPPSHCLPGSGWDIIGSSSVALGIPGLPEPNGKVKRLIVAKGRARQLVYYWYQSRGRVISEDWQKIVYVGWDRAVHGRTDGSLVRFTVPIIAGDEEKAESWFRDLAPMIVGRLPAYVPE